MQDCDKPIKTGALLVLIISPAPPFLSSSVFCHFSEKYICYGEQSHAVLKKLSEHGKKMFLITNSPFDFVWVWADSVRAADWLKTSCVGLLMLNWHYCKKTPPALYSFDTHTTSNRYFASACVCISSSVRDDEFLTHLWDSQVCFDCIKIAGKLSAQFKSIILPSFIWRFVTLIKDEVVWKLTQDVFFRVLIPLCFWKFFYFFCNLFINIPNDDTTVPQKEHINY